MNRIASILLACLFLAPHIHAQELNRQQRKLLDAPDNNEVNRVKDTISYTEVLKHWKSVEDINRWIGQNFHYDISRAIALGSKRDMGPKPSIFSPSEMFLIKSGICVDLSRFAFETLKKIKPEMDVHYLMIDFEPIEIQGSIIRKHWVIAYKQDEHFFIMADSKRPGNIAGPYDSIEEFIEDYQEFRQRKIESFKLLTDYKKTQKQRLAKTRKTRKGDNQSVNGQWLP